ncbi:MAG: peptidoglycan-binding domain 1 protein [Myxococcaceae bacterium]|nr:peptidoglycan-binding domain 1 protein [Myxococcaceae bacterium]
MSELELAQTVQRGSSGGDVHRVQEWLSLRGHGVQLDGEFGPATEQAVRAFQNESAVPTDGVVTPALFRLLNAPMRAALEPIRPVPGTQPGALLVAYATQHLRQQAREVGGNNRGPWVRLYTDGHDGTEWKWCAAFLTFCLQQACRTLGEPLPLRRTFSCDLLAESARQQNLLVTEDKLDRGRLKAGDLFLNRRVVGDWVHTGIVTTVQADAFDTIEGNSTDGGSRDGNDVAQRTRSFVHRDFILLSGLANVG